MDVNSVLSELIVNDISFPALKLAWNRQINVKENIFLPKMSPSHYMQENLLTTDQRRALICKQQRKVPSKKAGVDFIVEPAMIVFQNYKHGDTLRIPISIRNTSRMLQKVIVLMDETFAFQFDESSQRVLKFPCGISMNVTIKFQPEDDRDYYHKLVVITHKARFAIPIIGIGGRGLLDIPDCIIFDKVPVKNLKTKRVPVCNAGTRCAKFTLSTTGPFCVKPEKGVVLPKEVFSIEVSHYSATRGESDGHLLLKYDNGEEVYVYLKAESVNEDVTFTPQQVQCDDTYIGMKTMCVCCIKNNSDSILDFKWTKSAESNMKIVADSTEAYQLNFQTSEGNLKRAIDLLEHCVDGNDCLGLAMRLEDQMIGLQRSDIEEAFAHESFLLEPLIGQVQPYSSTDVYVIFSPLQPALDNAKAYLDITGVEKRIPLTISGKGLGAKFRFGFEVLNVGTVYQGNSHCYEIPVLNAGEISGKVDYDGLLANSSGLGLKVDPKKIALSPSEHGAFYVSLTAGTPPGDFMEDLKFLVRKTNEVIYVTIKGSINL